MIEILDLKILNKGALIAKFTAKITKMGGILIRDCSFFDSKGKQWMTFPSREYESEGKKKYFSYIAFEERTLDEKFKGKIMEELKKHLNPKPNVESGFVNINTDLSELPF